jgi:hypothetical protein
LKTKTKNQILLAVCATILVLAASFAFCLYDGTLTRNYPSTWNKFWLPVITNLLASLIVVAVTLLLLRHLVHDDSDALADTALGASLKQNFTQEFDAYKKVIDQTLESHRDKSSKALSDQHAALLEILSHEVHASSQLQAREIAEILTNFQTNQSNREPTRSVLNEDNSKKRKRNN